MLITKTGTIIAALAAGLVVASPAAAQPIDPKKVKKACRIMQSNGIPIAFEEGTVIDAKTPEGAHVKLKCVEGQWVATTKLIQSVGATPPSQTVVASRL
jgi:hypothetical protein